LLSGANASAPPFSFFLEMVNPNLRFLCGAVPSSSWAGKNAFGEVRAMSLEYDISENTSKVPALDQDKLKVYKVTLITGDIATLEDKEKYSPLVEVKPSSHLRFKPEKLIVRRAK